MSIERVLNKSNGDTSLRCQQGCLKKCLSLDQRLFLGTENLPPSKNGRPFPELSPGSLPDGDLLLVSCGLSGVSWQYPSQDGMKEARGRQTEGTAGAGGHIHLCSRVFLPGPTLCHLFFFFYLDKSLLGNECTRTGLWLSSPC